MDLLRRSTVAVTHADLNTVREALETGLPMVAIPVTNDQPGITAHVAWIGAGETIVFKHVTPWKLREATVRAILPYGRVDRAKLGARNLRSDGKRVTGVHIPCREMMSLLCAYSLDALYPPPYPHD